MKIKRYVDKDMRHVLRQVRLDQGPDAVILSNRRVDEGIEVIAAIDYDEALVRHALGTTPPGHDTDPAPDVEATSDEPVPPPAMDEPAPASALVEAPPAEMPVEEAPVMQPAEEDVVSIDPLASALAKPTGDTSLGEVREELRSLRGLVETQLSGLVWRESSRRSPLRAQVLRNLAMIGIAPDIANIIVNRLEPIDSLRELWREPLMTLAKAIPTTGDTLMDRGGNVALIGPTGVGKTTTIAKLAARFAMQHGADEVALICADSYRIGAREHLAAFANIIGVKVHAASTHDELTELLMQLRDKKLVLIDTEGRSQRDRDLANRLAAYGRHRDRVRFFLTLSATTQEAGLDEVVRQFDKVPLYGCIVTKVDEAGQLGCVLSTLIRHDLPLAWISDGQRIPDDLHMAESKRLWLVNQAVECIEASQPRIDERTMAEAYAEASVAHG